MSFGVLEAIIITLISLFILIIITGFIWIKKKKN